MFYIKDQYVNRNCLVNSNYRNILYRFGNLLEKMYDSLLRMKIGAEVSMNLGGLGLGVRLLLVGFSKFVR